MQAKGLPGAAAKPACGTSALSDGVGRMPRSGTLEPEVPDTSSVPWQVLPFVQSVEVVDGKVGYWFGFRQA